MTLEERVAALEEKLAFPLMSLTMDAPPLDEEQQRELREALGEAVREPLRVLPSRPLLTPEMARELLRECVTVVKPGEVLVMSMPEDWTPNQIGELHHSMRWWCERNAPDLKVLVVPACEFAVKEAEE